MRNWLYFIVILGGGVFLISFVTAGIASHFQFDQDQLADQVIFHPSANSQSNSPTNHQIKLACSYLSATTAQISDVTDPTSTKFHWVATSSDQFKTDTAILISNNEGPSSNFEPFTMEGLTWEAVATASQDLIPDPYNVETNPEWQASFALGNIKIAAPSWDGDDNSPGIHGLIRQRGDCIQIELATDNPIDYEIDNTGDIPLVVPIFPYRYRYDVFVSNWTPLSPMLSQYSKETAQ